MKRHPALIELSRDHHLTLQLAEALKTDGPATLRALLPGELHDRVEHVRAYFSREVEPHLELEEETIATALNDARDPGPALCQRLLGDHARLRHCVRRLPQRADAAAALDELGRLLIDHIRWEERELFVTMQEIFTGEDLTAVMRRASMESHGPGDRTGERPS